MCSKRDFSLKKKRKKKKRKQKKYKHKLSSAQFPYCKSVNLSDWLRKSASSGDKINMIVWYSWYTADIVTP